MNTELPSYTPISDERIAELTALATEADARIHILRRIRVKQDREWQEAVNLAGPNTSSSNDVRMTKVSAQYQPTSNEDIEADIVLLSYPKGDGKLDKGTTWGKEAKLNATNPREVFAVGEQKPDLHTILGQNSMYVVAPIKCTFGGFLSSVCGVWWSGSIREAKLDCVSSFNVAYGWFAFRV